MDFVERYGPWALVTGAANGLGAEFARQIAQRGLNVVLVDVDATALQRTATEIAAASGRQTRAIPFDLTRPDLLAVIENSTQDIEIGLLINNAAITVIGRFLDQPLPAHLRELDLNLRASVSLTHRYVPAMLRRKRGGVLFVNSLSGLQGTAYVAHYAATKAHLQIFAEGLWQEVQGQGVDVTGAMLGTTRTPGFLNSKPRLDRAKNVPIMEIPPTVTEALDSLGQGPRAVVGRFNRVITFILQRFLPRRSLIQLVSASTTALYGPGEK